MRKTELKINEFLFNCFSFNFIKHPILTKTLLRGIIYKMEEEQEMLSNPRGRKKIIKWKNK